MWSTGIILIFGCWTWNGAFASSTQQVTEVRAIFGSDALLPCVANFSTSNVSWRHVGKTRSPDKVLSNGSLLVENVNELDAGNYSCSPDLENTDLISVVRLVVLSPPSPVDDVEARAEMNFATVSWHLPPSSEHVEGFRISFAVASSDPDWMEPPYLMDISASTQITDIYHLTPGTSYIVRITAFNAAGSSKPVTISFRTLSEKEKCENDAQRPSGGTKKDWRSVGLFASGILFAVFLLLLVGPGLVWCRRQQLKNRSSGMLNDVDVVCETIELIPNIVVNPSFESEAAQKAEEET